MFVKKVLKKPPEEEEVNFKTLRVNKALRQKHQFDTSFVRLDPKPWFRKYIADYGKEDKQLPFFYFSAA